MAGLPSIDLAIAVPTLIGSSLSFLATFTALTLQIVRPPRRHFRHALIINLLVSDMMNSLNNTISGSVFLHWGHSPGPTTTPDVACITNAWIGQMSVQAIDFNIFIISVVVLLTVVKNDFISRLSIRVQVLVCMAAWIPGIITASVALGLHGYGYVSGNWCWIRIDRLDLRYGLTHSWRIGIFFATIVIYSYIYIRLKEMFKRLKRLRPSADAAREQPPVQSVAAGDPNAERSTSVATSVTLVSHDNHHNWIDNQASTFATRASQSVPTKETVSQAAPQSSAPLKIPSSVRKSLAMNGYPAAYIILWIPGLANRLAESTGGSPRWLKIMQSSTQFIGLVNAVTYGVGEQMRRQAWKSLKDNSRRFSATRRFSRSRSSSV